LQSEAVVLISILLLGGGKEVEAVGYDMDQGRGGGGVGVANDLAQ